MLTLLERPGLANARVSMEPTFRPTLAERHGAPPRSIWQGPEPTDYHRPAMRDRAISDPAMSDQLSLRLETGLPNPPATLRPMLPRLLPEPFDSQDHLFEPSWGGRRALAIIGPAATPGAGEVRLIGEDGVDLAPRLPELAGLAVRVEARSAVLDGELVAVDAAGRPDDAELERRLGGGLGRPVAYLTFDLLHLDGRSLIGLPLSRRRELLRKVLRAGDEVVAVPSIGGEGRALFDAIVEQGLAGMMARQRNGPYLPGIRSRLWRFIAARPSRSGAGRLNVGDSALGTAGVGEIDDVPGPAAAPVVALIRRLPFFEEEEPVGEPTLPADPTRPADQAEPGDPGPAG
jgi:ATP dependent DNA ligase domain